MMLDAQPDVRVVGEASTGRQVLAAMSRDDPDVVVMDIRMPDLDGLEATRRLTAAGSRAAVLVLTTFDLDQYVYDALRVGAAASCSRTARASSSPTPYERSRPVTPCSRRPSLGG